MMGSKGPTLTFEQAESCIVLRGLGMLRPVYHHELAHQKLEAIVASLPVPTSRRSVHTPSGTLSVWAVFDIVVNKISPPSPLRIMIAPRLRTGGPPTS